MRDEKKKKKMKRKSNFGSKAAFVSVVKEIKKTFYTLEGVWVRKENRVKRKIISVDRKICPLTL